MSIDLHSLVAPYALDALDPAERTEFEEHLDQCTSCVDELAGFAATAGRLGASHPATPPAALRANILQAIDTTPQERPAVTALRHPRRVRRLLPRLAVAAVFIIGAGVITTEHNNASDYQSANASITSVLAAEDASTKASAFESGGNVRMIASATRDAAVIVANDLPPLPNDKVYQVWMIDKTKATSQGTFRVNGTMVMKGLKGINRVSITVEPKSGSERPTTPPLVTLAI